jgi:hypothetical protein
VLNVSPSLARLCADLALAMSALAIEPPVWTSQVPRRLVLVELGRRQLRPKLFEDLTEDALRKVLAQVCTYNRLGARGVAGGGCLGTLVKREDDISDALLEALEWAVREALPHSAALGLSLEDRERTQRLAVVHQALRAHRAADDGQHDVAAEAMLEAQRSLVGWLSGDAAVADEAMRLRREQLAEMRQARAEVTL